MLSGAARRQQGYSRSHSQFYSSLCLKIKLIQVFWIKKYNEDIVLAHLDFKTKDALQLRNVMYFCTFLFLMLKQIENWSWTKKKSVCLKLFGKMLVILMRAIKTSQKHHCYNENTSSRVTKRFNRVRYTYCTISKLRIKYCTLVFRHY